jgi:hypothetical protein
MPNLLTTTMATGISGSFTALQELQKETNEAAVIDLQLNKDLSNTTSAEIKAQFAFTQSEASNQLSKGICDAVGLFASGATSLGALGLGSYKSPSEPMEEQPVKATIEEVEPTAAPASPAASLEASTASEPSSPSIKPEGTAVKSADERAVVNGENEEEKTSDATKTAADEEAEKAKAAKKFAKAKDTWQNQCAAIQTRYNTFGQAFGQFANSATTVVGSVFQQSATTNQGSATLAAGGLQNIQTAQSTINSALEQQRSQASAAAQAEISIIQAGHPIAG